MDVLISEVISATIQIILFSLIPFLVYVIREKKIAGFFSNVGLVSTTYKAVGLSFGAAIFFLTGALVLVAVDEGIRQVMTTPPSITGKFRAQGLSSITVCVILIVAWLKTSLSEEIFFRGFIASRLMKRFGYLIGNLAQSIIFAAVHFLLFWLMTRAEWPFLIFIFCFSGVGAFVIGSIKEHYGKGSIIPGWIAHGLGNTISYFVIAFVL